MEIAFTISATKKIDMSEFWILLLVLDGLSPLPDVGLVVNQVGSPILNN